ncbi:serine hydrolase-domain-containing protein [Coniochaeta sp. 2T2.1]|nr:serine hydrolase-domain-containing protein [Coniochaeta sp. 2T2.1]
MPPLPRRVIFGFSNIHNLTRSSFPVRHFATMADSSGTQTPTSSGPDRKPKTKGNSNAVPKKEVKILMLHGYTQSGPLFRSKTRALEKLLAKSLAPLNLLPVLIYPTAPNRLRPQDIPGYQRPQDETDDDEHGDQTDAWAWWRKDEASGSYRYLKEGMLRVAESIASAVTPAGEEEKEPEPVVGVVGFSQGGALAALLASAMELTPRQVPKEDEEWVTALREANRHHPLKFAVVYSGFYAPPKELGWLYEPKVKTPTLQFIGSLDTVVDESRSRGLVERCEEPVVVVHPGGHHVPVSKEWVGPLVGFIRKVVVGEEGKA